MPSPAPSDMADLSIPQHILDQIVAHARELAPFECCGLLAGTNKTVTHLYRITNIVAVEGAEKLSMRIKSPIWNGSHRRNARKSPS